MKWRASALSLLVLTSLLAFAQFPPLVHARSYFATRGYSYGERRILFGFRGLRLDLVEAELDRRLPRADDVALAPPLRDNDFLRQRFAEALYPRRIRPDAPYILATSGGSFLANLRGSAMPLFLAGPAAESPREIAEPSEADSSFLKLMPAALLLALCAAGLGWLCSRRRASSLGEAFLCGVVAVGVASVIATILQVSLPWSLLLLVGAGGALGAGWQARAWRPNLASSPEGVFFAGLAFFLGLDLTLLPVADWDARSIWFFRAKELFFSGFLSRADALQPAYAWSHANYPLLLPGWLAFFHLPQASSFSERSGTAALWLLHGALAACLWRGARAHFGRALGGSLAFAALLIVGPFAARGAADGALCLFLLVAYLEFRREPSAWFGWVCVGAASLLKWEGFLFGATLGLVLARGRAGLLVFLPAVALLAWGRFLGLPSDFQGAHWPSLAEAVQRTAVILAGGWSQLLRFPQYFGAAAAFAIGLAAGPRGWRKCEALGMAAFALVFVYVAFLLTPLDLKWHIDAAMARLLVHAAGFSLLALAEAGNARLKKG